MIALTLRLDDDMHEALRRESFERRVPINQIIRERIDAASEPQGEPSDDYEAGYAEGFHHGISSPRGSARDDRVDGEPSDAPTVQLAARKGGKTQGLIDRMLAQANERGIRVEIVDQAIPMYAMLDVWMALYGHDNSQAFDGFYESAGRAEAWATLLAAIRARAGEPQGEPSSAQVEAAAQAMFEPDGPGGDYTWAEMVVEDPSRADIWREDARKVLRAAGGVR